MMAKQLSFVAFTQKFATPEACILHLEKIRFKDGESCPHCGSMEKSIVVLIWRIGARIVGVIFI